MLETSEGVGNRNEVVVVAVVGVADTVTTVTDGIVNEEEREVMLVSWLNRGEATNHGKRA